MDDMKKLRDEYENIVIPKELNKKVMEAVEMGEANFNRENDNKLNNKRVKHWKAPATVVAAACVFVIGLNTSEAFASTMSDVPVVGKIFQALTIRSYESETQNENINTTIKKPELIVENNDETVNNEGVEEQILTAEEIAQRVNAEIDAKVEKYINAAQKHIEEYKKDFLATGGTEEQWNERDMTVIVDYEVKAQTEDILSLKMSYAQDWIAVYAQNDFYNISLKDGHDITLNELLGDDYENVIEESVIRQVKENMAKDSSLSYWIGVDGNDGGFVADDVFKNPKFYINSDGDVVVVFEKYAIAPGYMGMQEFIIK